MSKVIRTNFDRRELRRDRRYVSPPLTVTIAATDYVTRDWSLGGFQALTAAKVAVGNQVCGLVRVSGSQVAHAFTAQAVRCDRARDIVAFRFVEQSPALVKALDRAVINRLVGAR